MKLEFKLPALEGKPWRERLALQAFARQRDRSIIWLQMLVCLVTYPPSFLLARWLAFRFFPHSVLAALVFIYVILASPFFVFLQVLIIHPRINKALASGDK